MEIIFIIGASRCGTTMMASILGKNKDVFSFKEIHFFDELVKSKKPDDLINKKEATKLLAQLICSQENEYWYRYHYLKYDATASAYLSDKNEVTVDDVYQLFLKHYLNINKKSIVCKQTPRYIQHLNELYPFYKNSFFVHMVRDPRDSILSQKKRWKRRYLGGKTTCFETFRAWLQYNPIISSKVFTINVREGIKYENKERFLIIKYEDFVENPKMVLNKICSKTGILYSEEMLNIDHTSSSYIDSRKEKGISKQRKYAWMNGGLNTAEIYLIQKYTGNIIKHFKYEKSKVRPNPLLYVFYHFILPFQVLPILLINIKRKNVLKYFFKHS